MFLMYRVGKNATQKTATPIHKNIEICIRK